MQRELTAEFVGTFSLVSAVCGSALFSATMAGLVAIAFAVGLSVMAMAFAVGHISGAHFNPAVTCGLAAGGRFPAHDIPAYVIAQVVGGLVAAAVLYAIASGAPAFSVENGFAANGYGAHSPGQYALTACLLTEVVLTMMFVFVIMGATHGKAPVGFAPLAIGLCLTLVHLVGIPVTNLSVNPARSTGPAVFIGGWALTQLWLFWVAPIFGGVLGGILYRWLSEEPSVQVTGISPPAPAE